MSLRCEGYGLMHKPSGSILLGTAKYPSPMTEEEAQEVLQEKIAEVGPNVYDLINLERLKS